MAIIGTGDYKDVANLYADALTRLTGINQFYFDAAYEIVILQTFDPEVDLLIPFYNAYLASDTAYSSVPQAAVAAVRKLQDHILTRGSDKDTGLKYTEINDYYADFPAAFPTTVGSKALKANFGVISNQAGHTIEAQYVQA